MVAVASALKQVAPQTDVAIELGGEDAKINNVCIEMGGKAEDCVM